MDDETLDAIRKRAEAATPGPWRNDPHVDISQPGYEVYQAPTDGGAFGSSGTLGWTGARLDAEFIAHARTDVPRLLEFAREVLALADQYAKPTAHRSHGGLVPVNKVRDAARTLGGQA